MNGLFTQQQHATFQLIQLARAYLRQFGGWVTETETETVSLMS